MLKGDPLRLTLRAMERHNIVLGFLSDSLEDVFEWVKAAPDRFTASPVVIEPVKVDLARVRHESGLGTVLRQFSPGKRRTRTSKLRESAINLVVIRVGA